MLLLTLTVQMKIFIPLMLLTRLFMLKIKSLLSFLLVLFLFSACVSKKSSLKNVDENALTPKVSNENTFVITEFSKNPKYGYDQDFPINLYFRNIKEEPKNLERYFNALTGPKGEKIFYK